MGCNGTGTRARPTLRAVQCGNWNLRLSRARTALCILAQMTVPLESVQNCLSTRIGKELLAELWYANWDTPVSKTIEHLGIALGTNLGLKRSRNEDRIAVAQVTTGSKHQYTAILVCDGVGGSEMGDAAATIAIASFISELSLASTNPPLLSLLPALIRKTDTAVRLALGGRGSTTLSVLLVSGTGDIAAANVGDSRIYSWGQGLESFDQVSVDDTMENELRQLPIKDKSVLEAHGLRGKLSQAVGEPRRNTDELNIVVFGGAFFREGAVLATDGAWKSDSVGFTSIALNAGTPSDVTRRALAFANWTGGVDNVAVIAIRSVAGLIPLTVIPERLSSKATWATVWSGDFKFTVCEADSSQNFDRRKVPGTSVTKKLPVDDGAKAKTYVRKRSRGFKSVEPELDLAHSRDSESAKGGTRPLVEISTDDSSDKKS